jgi:hypothetical protein
VLLACVVPIVNYEGISVLKWSCFFYADVEHLINITGIMVNENYLQILKINVQLSRGRFIGKVLTSCRTNILNTPLGCAKRPLPAKKRKTASKSWYAPPHPPPHQSLDSNPIEKLWLNSIESKKGSKDKCRVLQRLERYLAGIL